MGFKDKLGKYYSDAYMQKYGDRISSASGTVVSIKFQARNYFIIKTLLVDMIIKSDVSKGVVKARYKKRRWFKKVEFIPISMGHKVMLMGLKGKKGKADAEVLQIQNVLNLTTKKDLVPVDHSQLKRSRQQAGRMRY